jgi:histidyl-tRNA synthetase
MLLGEAPADTAPIAFVPLGAEAEVVAQKLVFELRAKGLRVDMNYSGNMKKRLTRANKVGAQHTIILGEDELKAGIALVRDMEGGEQREVPLATLIEEMSA